MANTFWRLSIDHGDRNVWGPYTLANLKFSIGDHTGYLYNDAGTLKISKSWTGIDNGTVKGVSEIDTITSISIAAVSNGNWAEVYMSVSGPAVTFAAVDIAGATTELDIPATFLNAYDYTKDGYYINAARRCVGIIWKTAGGALSHIIQAHLNHRDLFVSNIYAPDTNGIIFRDVDRNLCFAARNSGGLSVENIYAYDDDGLFIRDNAGNISLFIEDGGNSIGVFSTDIESWDSNYAALESYQSAIMFRISGGNNIYLISNAYFDGAWKYKATAAAAMTNLASGEFSVSTVTSGTANNAITWVSKFKVSNTVDGAGVGGFAGGSDRDSYFYFASTDYIQWSESSQTFQLRFGGTAKYYFDSTHFFPIDSSVDIGNASNYWDDVNCCDVIDRSAFYIMNIDEAYNIIKNAVNEDTTGFCMKCEERGQKRLKYSHFPEYMYDDALENAEDDIIIDDNTIFNEESFQQRNMEIPILQKGIKIVNKGEKTRYRVNKKIIKDEQTGEEIEQKEILYSAEGMSYTGIISTLLSSQKKMILLLEEAISRIEILESQ